MTFELERTNQIQTSRHNRINVVSWSLKPTAIFFGVISAMASAVIPSTCSCTRADNTMSSRPTRQKQTLSVRWDDGHIQFQAAGESSCKLSELFGNSNPVTFGLTRWKLLIQVQADHFHVFNKKEPRDELLLSIGSRRPIFFTLSTLASAGP